MANKSAVGPVTSSRISVFPSRGGQPPYVRGKHTYASSARLIRFRNCVGDSLRGKSAGSREAVKAQFSDAAKKCKMGG